MTGVERIAARAVAVAVARVLARARDDLPRGVRVDREGDAVVLTGRALRARSRVDPRLRGVGR